jgi:hypothetical protein
MGLCITGALQEDTGHKELEKEQQSLDKSGEAKYRRRRP